MTEREALKLALEALKSSNKLINGTGTKFGLAGAMDGYYSGCFDVEGNNKLLIDAITAIKEALAQPEQELTTTLEASIHAGLDKKNDKNPQVDHQGKQPEQEPVAFSKEQMQIYADANYEAGYSTGYMDCAVKTHQDKNPVAYVKASELKELKHCNGMNLWAENAAIHTDDSISKQLLPSGHVPLYTTPPQRKPLTDEMVKQMRECSDEYNERGIFVDGWLSAEAAHGIKE